MKSLLKFIVENLVTNPKDVKVEENNISPTDLTLEISVNPKDMGLVIGKGGRTIKAMRSLIRTKAVLERKRVNLVLKEQG